MSTCAQCKAEYRPGTAKAGCPKCAPGTIISEAEFQKPVLGAAFATGGVRDPGNRGADRLAAAVARLVSNRAIDARSEAADALLDYLDVGGVGGPPDVPTWLRQYEARPEV